MPAVTTERRYKRKWTVLDAIEGENVHVFASYDVEPEACPKCGSPGQFVRHGRKWTDYVEVPVRGKKTTLTVDVRRYRCKSCGQTFLQPLPDMAPGRKMTRRCRDYIISQSLVRPVQHVARDVGVDEKTCRAVLQEIEPPLFAAQIVTPPRVLGVKSVNLTLGTCFVLIDVTETKVLDCVLNEGGLADWMAALKDPSKVEYITAGPLRSDVTIATRFLPDAKIVLDYFEIIKLANERMSAAQNLYGPGRGRLKGDRKTVKGRRLLCARGYTLSDRAKAILADWLADAPLLLRAWEAKEAFCDIWQRASKTQAQNAFSRWKAKFAKIPAFETLASVVDEWHDDAFRALDVGSCLPTTDVSSSVKQIMGSSGRSYGFDALRARVLKLDLTGNRRRYKCNYCSGVYPMIETRVLDHIGPPGITEQPSILVFICDDCSRTGSDQWFTAQQKDQGIEARAVKRRAEHVLQADKPAPSSESS
ncbi:transposase [Rhizobium ruizarguesonis]